MSGICLRLLFFYYYTFHYYVFLIVIVQPLGADLKSTGKTRCNKHVNCCDYLYISLCSILASVVPKPVYTMYLVYKELFLFLTLLHIIAACQNRSCEL